MKLNKALEKLEISLRERWVLTYLYCRDPGAASYCAELTGEHYWGMLNQIVKGRKCPVGLRWQRPREFRGQTGSIAVQRLSEMYEQPQDAIQYMCHGYDPNVSLAEISRRVEQHFLLSAEHTPMLVSLIGLSRDDFEHPKADAILRKWAKKSYVARDLCSSV